MLLALVLSMLSTDRAVSNATNTLHLIGWYGVRVGCTASVDGWTCVGRKGEAYAILRCSGDRPEPCSVRVWKP